VTLAAQDRLDDVALLEAADPSSILRQVASAAAQVREGARSAAEAVANVRLFEHPIPRDFWLELQTLGLVEAAAPLPC